jgi:hypothetical protein
VADFDRKARGYTYMSLLDPKCFIEVQAALHEPFEASAERAILVAKQQDFPLIFTYFGLDVPVDPEDDVQKIVSKWEEEKDGIKPEYLEHFMIMNQPSEPLTRFVFLPGGGCYLDRAVQQAILIHKEGIHEQTNLPFYLRFNSSDVEIKEGDDLAGVLERRETETKKYWDKFDQTTIGKQCQEEMDTIATEKKLATQLNALRNQDSPYRFPSYNIFGSRLGVKFFC